MHVRCTNPGAHEDVLEKLAEAGRSHVDCLHYEVGTSGSDMLCAHSATRYPVQKPSRCTRCHFRRAAYNEVDVLVEASLALIDMDCGNIAAAA
jgi:hypothetical protein